MERLNRRGHFSGLVTLVLLITIGAMGASLSAAPARTKKGAAQRESMQDAGAAQKADQPSPAGFGKDLAFLQRHLKIAVLSDAGGKAQVAVAPDLQGRVMTSTAGGAQGPSYGWINRDLIASGEKLPHINGYGSEDRFWFGPEGGQFGLYFKQGDPFDFDHWQVPAVIDTEPFQVVSQRPTQIVLTKTTRLVNHSGTAFDVKVERMVRLLDRLEAAKRLGLSLDPALKLVAYESDNALTNTGKAAWTRETGLISIWILGMMNASPTTTIVLPFVEGPETMLGPIVNDAYFGKVSADRMKIGKGVIFFKGDSRMRGKLGLSPRRAKPILGSYDKASGTLTLIQYTKPEGALHYVNSMWEQQKNPYGGDVDNAYNDGPPKPGMKQIGRFYELESSSPAEALAPGASLTHIQRTFHIQGSPAALDFLARTILGVGIEEIAAAF